MQVTCPKCHIGGAYELFDEVDIGVGVQKHVYGYDCPLCGQIGVCASCGALDFRPHASWCETAKSIE
jgi:hypothetical protein